jgi:cysteine synthase B
MSDARPAPRVDGALESIVEAIGNTPLLRLRLPDVPAGVEILAKCEWFNPGGSVKDRTALSLIGEGERAGTLRPGKTIIDSSSGNTAVGLALVGRAKGYPVDLYMPASASIARQRLCAAYGARVTLTDAFSGSDGALTAVRERVAAEPERYFYADQYRNPANPLAHYRTTGPEIWNQTGGRVTHFVAGLGTSGTVVGTSRYLRERNRRVRILAIQPDDALHGFEGLKHMATSIVPEIYDTKAHDEVLRVATESGYQACADVLASDGVFVGHSAGGALAGARALAQSLRTGVIVVMLPDGGERYLAEDAARGGR